MVLTGRNDAKGRDALERIRRQFPDAKISYETLDLASLASVADFATGFVAGHGSLDLLINNAGVMALPKRQQTSDGFEMQFGTNYLGHYALTAHLLPLLRRGNQPRVVNLSSLAHRSGKIDFDDLQGAKSYNSFKAYCQSKLAMLMFALELQRRSDAAGWGLMSNAAHPGYALNRPDRDGPGTSGLMGVSRQVAAAFCQSFRGGRRAADPVRRDVAGGEGRRLVWPERILRTEGPPAPARIMPRGERRRGGRPALGCLRHAHGGVVCPGRRGRLNV